MVVDICFRKYKTGWTGNSKSCFRLLVFLDSKYLSSCPLGTISYSQIFPMLLIRFNKDINATTIDVDRTTCVQRVKILILDHCFCHSSKRFRRGRIYIPQLNSLLTGHSKYSKCFIIGLEIRATTERRNITINFLAQIRHHKFL